MNSDKKTNFSEDKPGDINYDEVGFTPPGKELKAQHKVTIVQSGFGREQGQTPADEHIEHFSQIENDTGNKNSNDTSDESHDGFRETINSTDERDPEDSTTDRDAQNNKSGRHK